MTTALDTNVIIALWNSAESLNSDARKALTLPRRILADFIIGAHATVTGCRLLTLDAGVYPLAFPHLPIVRV